MTDALSPPSAINRSRLRGSSLLSRINRLPILQTSMYHGTSGACLVSPTLDGFVHLFNSYSYLCSPESKGSYTISFRSGKMFHQEKVHLGPLESKIFDLRKVFSSANNERVIGSYRIRHDFENQEFVPYTFTSLISRKSQAYSTVHSSSFGNACIDETVTYSPDFLFDLDLLSRSELILLSLYDRSAASESMYSIELSDLDSGRIVSSQKKSFCGDLFNIDLMNLCSEALPDRAYQLRIVGPAAANPYLLVNGQTFFHF